MFRKLLFTALAVCMCALSASAQTLVTLKHQTPAGIAQVFLMTDGTVIGPDLNTPETWWKLTPDITGSYINGTWTKIASLSYGPDAFSGAVLADGRLLVVGGEYSYYAGQNYYFTLTNQGAIYDPVANTWTAINPPAGWQNIGDSPNTVLPNGTFLIGQKLTENMALYTPSTGTWQAMNSAGKNDFNSEEGWTLLPNGNIITADVKNAPNSEIYEPGSPQWISAGSTIVDLHSPTDVSGCLPYPPSTGCYYPPGEIGPAILRPDGTVFFTGSYTNNNTNDSGHTAIYNYKKQQWTEGPDFPYTKVAGATYGDNAGDNWAVLLPTGNVLVEGQYGWGYEFNGSTLSRTTTTSTYLGALLVLPNGQVFAGGATPQQNPTMVYVPKGSYNSAWQPTITSIQATSLSHGSTYKISGTQFNGLSQACALGDEDQCATNYPLVRITNNTTHHVFYARTHGHSTMAVATGSSTVSTNFDVPPSAEAGASTLVVIANGIPSASISVTIKSGCATSELDDPEC